MENLRVSTMTAICNISDKIDLKNLHTHLNINDTIKFIDLKGLDPRGYSSKQNKVKRKKKEKKTFYNQVTIHVFNEKIVNTKVFNNGNIQMTGLKSKEMGENVVKKLIMEIKENNKNLEKEDLIYNGDLIMKNFDIVLINSDFDIKFKINRDELQRYMYKLNMYSTYEPTIYPGVNIKYFYNILKKNSGVCNCCEYCNGKGNGSGDGNCKKVTIAVFQSGKIIITGGRNFEQVVECYKYIYNILSKNKKMFEIPLNVESISNIRSN